jgi:hypothetical protein
VRLRVWEEGGKAKTTIKVCLVDSKGYHEEVASQTLNTTDAEKDHENQVFDKTLGNALGRYVVCIIDTTSVFSNFKYAIELNQA